MKRGFLSNEQRATRGIVHGKINSLATAFKLAAESPFTIVIVPKENVTSGVIASPANAGLLVNMKMYEDDAASMYPVMFNWPSEALIYEIQAGAIDLAVYDVYWICGSYDTEPGT